MLTGKFLIAKAIVVVALAMYSLGLAAQEVPRSFTYQGKIVKANGVDPLEDNSVLFTLQIRSPDGLCLLFEETHWRDMTSTGGLFSLIVGEGSNTNASNLNLVQVFDNSTSKTGAAGCSYTPVAGDSRRLRFSYNDGAQTVSIPMDQYLRSVPYAMNASTIAGLSKDKLLQTSATSTQAAIDALTAGTSSQYAKSADLPISSGVLDLSSTGVKVPDVPTNANNAVNRNYTDSRLGGETLNLTGLANGQVLQWNTAQNRWNAATPNAGTLTSITAGTGLSGGTITSTGTISLANSGVTAGTYPKVTVDAMGRVTTGSSLVEADIPTITTAGKVSASALSSGTIGGSTAINTSGAISTSGNVSATNISSTTASLQNLRVFDGSNNRKVSIAASGTMPADYSLILPLTAGASGQVLSTDGSGNLSWASSSSFSVTSITGTAPVIVGGTSSVPVISVSPATTSATGLVQLAADGGTTASTVVQATDSRLTNSRAPNGSASGDLSGSYPAPTVAKIQGVAVNSATPVSGQAMRYSGTQWAPAYFNFADLKNSFGVAQIPSNCSTSQTMTYSSITDQFSCQTISVSLGVISGLGTGASKDVPVTGNASSTQLVLGSDTRLTDARTPSGSAGGDLTGNYPSPTLTTTGVTAGMYPKVTVDNKGRVTAGASLATSDIPSLDWSKITSGTPTTLLGYGITDAVKAGAAANVTSVVYADSGSKTVTVRAPTSLTNSYTLKFPTDLGTAGQILSTDASGNLSWLTPNVGTVTNVTASGPLSSTGGATPAISIVKADSTHDGYLAQADFNTFAAKMSTTLSSGSMWVGNGSNVATAVTPSGDLTMNSSGVFSVTKVQGLSFSSSTPTAGQFMKYVSGTWGAASLNISDLKSSISGNLFPSATCAATETLSWSSTTDTFTCAAIQDASTTQKGLMRAGTGLVTSNGTVSVDVGTGANNIVRLNGSGQLPAVDASNLVGLSVPFSNMVAYDASNSWLVPANVTKVYVQAWGGGGAGGSGTALFGGVGGGGGGYGAAMIPVTPGNTINFTVGAGGVAGTAGNAGGNGGTTTFSTMTVTGGAGGGVSAAAVASLGGTSTATINVSGGRGTIGIALTALTIGGIGGHAGNGGGFGGPGAPGAGLPGYAGTAPGGGGGGGGGNLVVLSSLAGAGAAGRIIIWY